ncbi:MAG TPA: hypothetical protein VNA04_13700 [Thermoanaerobaculia bacterium]|nr:hypothetical protein [Thermoanaerobaculia bacterium]
MKVVVAAFFMLVVACGWGDPVVPLNTQLWRLDRAWEAPPPGARQDVRTAPGTIIAFRGGGEYVEVHCSLIEQPDQTVLIQSGRPCVAAVGTWEQRGSEIVATRSRVGGPGRPEALRSAFCSQPRLTFRIEGRSVSGNAGGEGTGTYTPVTRFVAPEFETYVTAARRSDVRCGED